MLKSRIFSILLLGMFMLSFSSAFDWGNGVVSYYKLDELSGDVIDSAGIYDGTNSGALTGATGIINNSYDFDGVSDYINITSLANTLNNTAIGTWSIWINPTYGTSTIDYVPIMFGNSVINDQLRVYLKSTGQIVATSHDGATNTDNWNIITDDVLASDGTWMNIVIVQDGISPILYIDGASVAQTFSTSNDKTTWFSAASFDVGSIGRFYNGAGAQNYFDGLIDEVAIFDRTLNDSEILELYNSGLGLSYPIASIPTINLSYPANGTTISDVGANFTVEGNNLSDVGGSWKNITYLVYQNNTLMNSTTVVIPNNETFIQIQFIDNFVYDNYEWNAIACYSNSTGDYCITSEYNNTFAVSLFTIISENYVENTVSGTLENFSISIDLLDGYALTDALFLYNETSRFPTIMSEGNNRYLLVSNYQIPIILSDENISFYWNLTFNNVEIFSSDSRTQLVSAILLDNCSLYTNKIFNISLYDETSKSLLTGNIEMSYSILNYPSYSILNTISFKANDINNTGVCSSINLSAENLYYSSEIRYSAIGYAPELYNIQRAEIINSIPNIRLFDLNSTASTEFKIIYQDSTFNFVEGAIVQLQRKYISEGIYETVEAPLTSNEGISVVHIDLDSVRYRATITKNGVVLDEFDNLVFKCQSELTGECEQKLLGTINPQNNINFETYKDFSYSINRVDNAITLSFSVPSGSPSKINIQLMQKDQFGSKNLCNNTILSSAGSMQCTFDYTIGDSFLDLNIYKDGYPITYISYVIPEVGGVDFLGNNYIIVVVLLLSIVGMALTSPEWIIMNGIVVMIISGALWLLNGLDFVVGLGSLMWLLMAAVIIIFKLAKQEDR